MTGSPALNWSSPQRTDLVVERIRTLATARGAFACERANGGLATARQVAAEAMRASPPRRGLILVRLQDALTPLAEGELAARNSRPESCPSSAWSRRGRRCEASDLLERLIRS